MIQSADLPEGWALATLDQIAASFSGALTDGPFGSNLKTSHYTDVGPRVIRLQNVGEMVYREADAHISPDHFETLRRHEAISGDVIIAMLGDRLPRACQVPVGLGDAIVKADCARLRPSQEMSARYVMYALNSQPVRDTAAGLIHGLGRPRLGLGLLRGLHIPTAPGGEQPRIVEALDSYLSRLDAAQAALERVQTNLTRYRASVLQAAVEGRLVPTEAELACKQGRDYEPASALLERILIERRQRWEQAELAKLRAKGKEPQNDKWKAKYKEPAAPDTSELPDLPEGWCWATLHQLSWARSYGTSVRCDPVADGVPVLRIPNVAASRIDLDDLKYATKDIGKAPAELLARGDFLIIRTNGSRSLIGRAAYLAVTPDTALFFASYLIRFRLLGEPVTGRWLSHFWCAPTTRAKLESLAATSAGQYNLSMTSLSPVVIAIPPADEQARLCEEIDAAVSIAETQAQDVSTASDRLSTLRQAILKWAFEGKLVDQDPSEEPASVLLDRIHAERQANPPTKRTRRKKKATT